MRVLGMVMVVGAAGCHTVFDLEEVDVPPGDDGGMSACWDAAHPAADEDGDMIVDGCDLCPADPALSSDEDIDVDGMPDTCDPDLTSASTVITFDGFTTQRSWEPVNGAWGITGGAYGVVEAGTARTELTIPLAEEPRIDVIFDSPTGVGLTFETAPSRTLIVCRHEKRSGTDVLIMQIGGGALMEMVLDNGLDNGRLRAGIDATGAVYCRGVRGGVPASIMGPVVTDRATTRIGLIGVDSRFPSVTVFGKK